MAPELSTSHGASTVWSYLCALCRSVRGRGKKRQFILMVPRWLAVVGMLLVGAGLLHLRWSFHEQVRSIQSPLPLRPAPFAGGPSLGRCMDLEGCSDRAGLVGRLSGFTKDCGHAIAGDGNLCLQAGSECSCIRWSCALSECSVTRWSCALSECGVTRCSCAHCECIVTHCTCALSECGVTCWSCALSECSVTCWSCALSECSVIRCSCALSECSVTRCLCALVSYFSWIMLCGAHLDHLHFSMDGLVVTSKPSSRHVWLKMSPNAAMLGRGSSLFHSPRKITPSFKKLGLQKTCAYWLTRKWHFNEICACYDELCFNSEDTTLNAVPSMVLDWT